MLSDAFYFLLNMSIAASAAGLVVLLVCRIRRMPRRLAALLFAIPFLRAVVPVALGSRYSLLALIGKITARPVVAVPLVHGQPFFTANFIQQAESYDPIVYKSDMIGRVFRVAAIVWLIGAAAILIALGMVYIATMREMRGAKRVGDGLYISDKVLSPAVYGIFRPRIVFPADGAINEYALAHERAHVKRLDNLRRLIAFAAAAVHWFNPISWVLLRNFLSELELACDETVIRGLNGEERKEYALALIECSRSKTLFASAFGGAKVRTRIDRVLSYKGMTWLSLAAFLLLSAAVAAILITNPR